jgi:hypothetical protein
VVVGSFLLILQLLYDRDSALFTWFWKLQFPQVRWENLIPTIGDFNESTQSLARGEEMK